MKFILAIILLIVPFFHLMAELETDSPDAPKLEVIEASLTIWNRDIYSFKYAAQKGSVENRVKLIKAELKKLSTTDMGQAVFYSKHNSLFGQNYNVIMLGDKNNPESAKALFSLFESDLDDGKTLDEESALITKRLEELFKAKQQQEKLPVILKGLMYSIFSCVILVVSFRLLLWLREKSQGIFSKKIFKFIPNVRGFDSRDLCYETVQFLIKLPFWIINMLLIYFWITYILSQFPYTLPWAESLGAFIVSKLLLILSSIAMSIPGIIMAVLIFYLVYVATKVVNGFFLSIENNKLETKIFDSDTARITRRIVVFLLWLLAIIFTYPYLPGSSSEAFKGVSVFLGLLISLGSTGVVNQVMSGLVIVYSKSMTKGDIISVAEIEGIVKEVGFLSTKVITPKKQEVTIPNSVITTNKVINFSRVDEGAGVTMATQMTIGYDTPWRQVHAMLKIAAERTDRVRNDPPAEIIQTALDDFYVSYELRVKLEKAEDRFDSLTELHANILDVFNEYGVQIMSPNFHSQPDSDVLVKKENWFQKPASES